MLVKFKFYRNAEPGENGGSAASAEEGKTAAAAAGSEGAGAEAGAEGIAPLVEVKTIDQVELPETIEEYEAQMKAKDPDGEKKPTEAEAAAAAATEAEKKKAEEAGTAVTDDGKKKPGEGEETQTFGEEVVNKLEAEPGSSDEEQLTYKGLGETFGATVADETYEAFETGMKARIEAAKEEGRQEVTQRYTPEALATLEPEALDLVNYLSIKDNTVQTYMNQLKPYDDILTSTAEEQVRLNYKGLKWDDDKIDVRIAELKESGKLNDEAYAVQKRVEVLREERKQQIAEDSRNKAQNRQQQILEERTKEDTAFEKELSRLNQFMGHDLSDKIKQAIAKRWKAGEYRGRLRDSVSDVVQSILYLELGAEAQKNLSKRAYQTGKNSFKEEDVHNIDRKAGKSGATEVEQAQKFEGFDEWDNLRAKEKAAAGQA